MNQRLYNYSLYLLGRRDYSVKELKKKFKEKEYLDEDVEVVLKSIIENNYQSDERFTRSFINQKINARVGTSKIKSLLIYDKGINKEMVEEIISEYVSNDIANISSILNIKYRNKNLKDFKEKTKAFRFLVSKGFSFDDINKAFAEHNIDLDNNFD